MKVLRVLIACVSSALLLTACGKAPDVAVPVGQSATDGAAANGTGMPHAAPSPAPTATGAAAEAATTTIASATVKATDATLGTITLAHGPIESLGWPAMTMPFKATPEQIAAVKVGQVVSVEFQAQGMNATITKLGTAR